MPWLEEFSDVIELARRAAGEREAGPGASGRVTVEDPVAGFVQGAVEVERFVERSRQWVVEHAARVEQISLTTTPARTVAEFTVTVTQLDRSAIVPLVLVVEPASPDTRLRIYCSLWALSGERIIRPPILASDPGAHPADAPGRYLRALRDGDAAACVACYEDDGCLQGAGGPAFARCGMAALAVEYPKHLERGGIVLEPCTLTANEERSAVEFNIVRWGDVDLPPQAGLSVYQLGTSGRILSNRVYDDVARPWA
jgi:hypothetical protein